MRHLPLIFSSESVAGYGDEELRRIAAETLETVAKRKQLEDLQRHLGDGLEDLGRHSVSS